MNRTASQRHLSAQLAERIRKINQEKVGPMNENAIWYGPHQCGRRQGDGMPCTVNIIKQAREQGGLELEVPQEPIYPNTRWQTHQCPNG